MDPIQYHRILLIRARPGDPASCRAQEQSRQWSAEGTRRLLVFFHGDGVEHAAGEPSAQWRRLSGWHDTVLAVCSGSWSRRHDEAPAAPFELSSLTVFWHHALDARELACFGAKRER